MRPPAFHRRRDRLAAQPDHRAPPNGVKQLRDLSTKRPMLRPEPANGGPMSIKTSGLHHVTAIAGDPQRNADFYLRTLGLRLVKTTVNFDDPGTYHLYYGDQSGKPGTLLTFFPWRDAPAGRHGTGQATTASFSVPENSIGWWKDHLNQ